MNRRRFLGQTAKVAAGLVAASVVPVPATEIISVAEPIIEPQWQDIDFKVQNLTGDFVIGRDLLEDWAWVFPQFEREIEALFQRAINV